MKTFWVSWWLPGDTDFSMGWPWWVSGMRVSDDAESIVAAVAFESEEIMRDFVTKSHKPAPPGGLEWRFVEEKTDSDWSPYSDRFPKGQWMPDFPLAVAHVAQASVPVYRLSAEGSHPKMGGQSRYRIEIVGKPGAVGFVYLQPEIADQLREQLKRSWREVTEDEDDW